MQLSVLDLSPICQGSDAADSFRASVALAQRAEFLGYQRYWLAEHHNIPSVASSATSVLIGHIAGATQTIRVGSGGIMLPNHAPLVIAEQFGTLASLYPDRIDLGLGRAPGGDMRTAYALRRTLGSSGDSFPDDLEELRSYFRGDAAVQAIPGTGLNVPIWLLGSSDFSARLAARLGLPFAFASHFAPGFLQGALQIYRSEFRPSAELKEPYVMVAAGLCAADTEAEARRLFTTTQQTMLGLVRNRLGPLKPPVDSMDGLWHPSEEQAVARMLQYAVVGDREQVEAGIARIARETRADELIVTAQQYHLADRLHNLEITAEACKSIAVARAD